MLCCRALAVLSGHFFQKEKTLTKGKAPSGRDNVRYKSITEATFISRPNRFIANVDIDGVRETVHVKNTGRCKELLLPGSTVILEDCESPGRKTRYDLVAVKKEGLGWVNIDSQAPNAAVKEWLESENSIFSNADLIKPEFGYGKSRVDFYVEIGDRRILIEVKGCTLERDGVGYFPDAPTERGVKHLRELASAAAEGFECYIAFVIAMPKVRRVLPNETTHPAFAEALKQARYAGVGVLFFTCDTEPGELSVTECIFDK